MSIEIVALTPTTTDPLWSAYARCVNDLDAERDPQRPQRNEALLRSALISNSTFAVSTLVAVDGSAVLGYSTIWHHYRSTNRDKAECEMAVQRGQRRQGVGRALLRATIDLAEADGRSFLTGASPIDDSSKAFWSDMGGEFALTERESRCWLADTDPELMESWIDQRMDRAGEYRLEALIGAVSREQRGRIALLHTAMNDAPLDKLIWDDETWSDSETAEYEALLAARNVETHRIVALDQNGEPAGLTEAHILNDQATISDQGDTIVVDKHRQKGIGRWLKAAMWQHIRSSRPDVEALDTENAESNDPMLAINVAMGFKPLLTWGIWQASTEDFRSAIG